MPRSPDSHNDQASTNYKEAFSLFDKRGTGKVSLESLGDLLRACGQNPTLAEIADLEKSIGGDCELLLASGSRCSKLTILLVDFESFLKVLNRPGGFREPGEPEEYCRGFQVFDKDMTGFIGVGQLRYSMLLCCAFSWLWDTVLTAVVLTNLGEKMSDEEVDELLKAVDTSSGEINYTGMFSCLLPC
jgi:Ca2+-binding EF-hand superfamily protein